MATYSSAVDMRRVDVRSNVLTNPFWITSKELDHASFSSSVAGIVLDFPASMGHTYRIRDVAMEVTEAYAGASSGAIICGIGSVPASFTSSASAQTITYASASASVLLTVSASAGAIATGVNVAASSAATLKTITCGDGSASSASSNMSVIYFKQSGTPTAGKTRVHLLVDRLPTVS